MQKSAPKAIDAQCLDALMQHHAHAPSGIPSSGGAAAANEDLLKLSAQVGASGGRGTVTSAADSGNDEDLRGSVKISQKEQK